jgi:beta-N-acetylhexosaminidase
MVRTGLSMLLDERLDSLSGCKVGIVSHAAAVTPNLTGILDALRSRGVQVTALFGPEHGFGGTAADGKAVGNTIDSYTKIPVFSLYGDKREPDAQMLENVDSLVVDFQDVGVRFYTYLSTLFYVIRASGKHRLPVLVLDRPNPIAGIQIEGPFIEPGFESFVGIVKELPIRHGMTMGELSRYLNGEYSLGAQLTVVPMEGWSRSMWFDQTGLPWVSPSPAIPSLAAAIVYPGTCFVEGTNLSEGRGTALPFEVIGAPWIDGRTLAEEMNRLALPGVRFRQVSFEPSASKHAGRICSGVQLHVLDREAFRPVITGLYLVAGCQALAPDHFAFLEHSWEGHPCHMDLLAGSAHIREHITLRHPVASLLEEWRPFEDQFAVLRKPYLLYT